MAEQEEDARKRVCVHCGETAEFSAEGQCQNCRAYVSPFSDQPDMWLLVPPRWLGIHAERHAEAIGAAAKWNSNLLTNFAAAVALMEDWRLPGLEGNPEKWDFGAIDLPIIAWVNGTVMSSYMASYNVPKNF